MLSLKRALIQKLRAEIHDELGALERAAGSPEPDRPDDDAPEAARIRELRRVAEALVELPLRSFSSSEPIDGSALVEITLGRERLHCFVAPVGGGLKVDLYGKEIQVVTPQSPVGRALLGRRAGDVVDVATQQGVRSYRILAVV